jgi:hypothetical protein
MYRALLVVSLLGLLGVLLWLVLAPEPGSPPVPEGGEPRDAPEGRPLARAPVQPLPRGPNRRSEPEVERPSDASGHPELAPLSAHRRGPSLLVVDGESGKPAAGARVVFVEPDRIEDVWRAPFFGGEVTAEEAFARWGVERTAGENGTVALPPFLVRLLVLGEKGDRWNRAELSHEDPPADGVWRLALFPAERLGVRVIDAAGRPQPGVPVRLRVSNDREFRFVRWNGERAVTGGDGIARFRPRPAMLAHARAGNELTARLEVPGIPRVEARIAVSPWPTLPVQLELPPTGRVKVRVGLPPGETAQVPTRVCLRVEGDEEIRVVEDGTAVFPHVALETRLEVSVRRDGQPEQRAAGRSPERAGEEVLIEVNLARRDAWISGRAVTTAGRADPDWRSVRLEIRYAPDRPPLTPSARLEADGRFRVARVRTLDAVESVCVRVQALDWRGIRAMSDWRDATLGDEATTELGEVSLQDAPLWAAGEIVNENGEPVPWVEVGVSCPEMLQRSTLPQTMTVVRSENSSRTRPYHTRSDAEGRFEIRGPVPSGPFRLEFHRPGHLDAERDEVRPGTTGLEVTLPRFGRLEGRLLLPAGLVPGQVSVDVFRSGGKRVRALPPGLDRRFEVERLLPGVYDVGIRVAGGSVAEVRIPGVEVRGAATSRDPRLAEVDLRSRLAMLTLRVVGDDGKPLPDACCLLGGGSEPAVRVCADEAGRARLWAGSTGIDVEVRAPGHRFLRLEGLATDRTVTLRRGYAVQIRYGGVGVLPERAVLLLRLTLAEEAAGQETGALWPEPVRVTLSHPSDAVTLYVPVPGRYEASLSLRDRTRGRTPRELAASLPHVILHEKELVVRDAEAPQTFTLDVPQEAMLGGIEEFGRALARSDEDG